MAGANDGDSHHPLSQVSHIRPATLEDLDAIYEIEKLSFGSPWPREALAEEIQGRSWSHVLVNLADNTIVGFLVYWTVGPEVHLLNLGVHPEWRRQKTGTALTKKLIEIAQKENKEEIFLEVRVSNAAARSLYDSLGFKGLELRKNYYPDSGEDARVMELRLEDLQ